MKTRFTFASILILCIGFSFYNAEAQYSTTALNQNIDFTSLSENDIVHPDSMDAVTNLSKLDVEVFFEVKNHSGKVTRSGASIRGDSALAINGTMRLNQNIMRGKAPFKMIIKAPIKITSSDQSFKGYKISFNEHFQPTMTNIYLNRDNELVTVYIFENGRQEVDEDHEHEKKIKSHVKGHICDPTSEICG